MSASDRFRLQARFASLLALTGIVACTTVPEAPVVEPRTAPPPVLTKPSVVPRPKPSLPPAKDGEGPPPALATAKGIDELRKGVLRYDDGEYKDAARHFQRALELGLPAPGDQATAHKHLAFIACVASRSAQCRADFRKALDADPSFDLAAAEAGHPMWGPVFRSVKAEVDKRRKSDADKARKPAPPDSRAPGAGR